MFLGENRRYLRLAALVALGVLASATVLFTTPYGPGILGDSFHYLFASETLAAGRGLGRLSGGGEFKPLTHYPPFYSMAMASLQVFGLDKLESSQWVNAVSAGALVVLLGLLLNHQTGKAWPAVVACLILTTSPSMLDVNIWALSEAPYLLLSWASVAALARFLETRRTWLLLAAGFLTSTAYLTRYVGSSLVVAGVLILLSSRGSLRRRLRDAAGFSLVALGPMLAWMVRNYIWTGNLANRRVLWHPVELSHARSLFLHVLSWLVPKWLIQGRIIALILALLLGAALAAMVARAYKTRKAQGRMSLTFLERLIALNVVIYLVQLAVSISLFDVSTPIDNRILSPVHVFVIALTVLLVAETWEAAGRMAKYGFAAYLAVLVLSNTSSLVAHALSYRMDGLGYGHRSWLESRTIQAVKEFPDVPIYTNGITEIYIHAGRSSYPIPRRIERDTGMPIEDYQRQMELMHSRLREEDARLVLFNRHVLPEQVSLEDLTAGLTIVGEFEDGTIYDFVP